MDARNDAWSLRPLTERDRIRHGDTVKLSQRWRYTDDPQISGINTEKRSG